MDRTGRYIVRLLVSPVLYLACIVPALVGVFAAFISTEFGGFLHRYAEPLYRYDHLTPSTDEVGLAIVFVIAGLVFGVAGRALILLERLSRPTLLDHLRRCASFYVLFVLLSAIQIPEYAKAQRLPGYPVPEFQDQVLWLVIVCAILIDALMLSWRRWRHVHAGFEARA